MIQRTLPFVTALVLLAGCGGSDDDKVAAPASIGTPTTTTAATGEAGRFAADDVAFTFSYPEDFKRDDADDDKQVAQLTPGPDEGRRNAIRISFVSEQPLPFESYIDTFRQQFEDDLGTKVTKGREQHGDFPMGTLKWDKDFTYTDLGEEKTTHLESASYLFMTGGKAWHIECVSETDYREQVDAACKQVLDTIEPTG